MQLSETTLLTTLIDLLSSSRDVWFYDRDELVIEARCWVGTRFGYADASDLPHRDLFELCVDILREGR